MISFLRRSIKPSLKTAVVDTPMRLRHVTTAAGRLSTWLMLVLGLLIISSEALADSTADEPVTVNREVGPTLIPSEQQALGCPELLPVEQYAAAIKSADLALSRLAVSNNPDTRFMQLVCRGSAHQALANSGNAEKDLREALRVASKHFEAFDPRLTEPLTRLGRLRLAAEDYEGAELLLLRARDITHRNQGVYNLEQQPLLTDLTKVYRQQGMKQMANRQQELRLKSARETHGDSPELVPSLHHYAVYNASVGRFAQVREALEQAVNILETAYGETDPRLIETLRLRAGLYKMHPSIVAPKAGEEAMQRVIDIYESQEFVDQVDVLNARTDFGDWYVRSLRFRRGIKEYKKAVKQGLASGMNPEAIDKLYGKPHLLFFHSSNFSYFGRDDAGELVPSGHLRYRFNITASGKARSVELIEDTVNVPAIAKEFRDRIYHTAYYRPRFSNGKAVETRAVEQRFDIEQSGSGSLSLGKIHAPEIPGDTTP